MRRLALFLALPLAVPASLPAQEAAKPAAPAPVKEGGGFAEGRMGDIPEGAAELVTAETDAAAAWRSVLERGTDRALRRAGLAALIGTAARCARWREVVGTHPAVPVFPGRP